MADHEHGEGASGPKQLQARGKDTLILYDLRLNKDATSLISTTTVPTSAPAGAAPSSSGPVQTGPGESSDPSSLLTAWVTRIYSPDNPVPPPQVAVTASSALSPTTVEQQIPLEFEKFFTESVYSVKRNLHHESPPPPPTSNKLLIVSIKCVGDAPWRRYPCGSRRAARFCYHH